MQIGKKTYPLQYQLIFLFVLAFGLYANTLNHDYALDDYSVIKDNWVVKSGSEAYSTIFTTPYRYGYWNSPGTLYRPLTLSMFAFEWSIAPDTPALSHWINVIAYACSILLLLLFLYQLFDPKYHLLLFLSVLLFTVHPIHTEVVANIKSRDEIMAFLLSLGGMLSFLKLYTKNKAQALIALGGLYFIGLLFKEGTITLTLIFPAVVYLFYKDKTKAISSLIPMGIGAVAYLLLRQNAIGDFVANTDSVAELDNFLTGIDNPIDRFATALKLMGVYFMKLIFPHPLSNDYSIPHFSVSTFSDWKVWFTLIVCIGGLALAWMKEKNNKLLWFAILWFFGTMALYTNLFITIGSHFGERFLFLPSLGFCIILVWGINQILKQKNKLLLPTLIPVLLVFIFLSFNRNKAWKDNFTLYETDVINTPNSARTNYYYGLGLMKDKALTTNNAQEKTKYLQQAFEQFKKAIELYPTYPDAWANLGLSTYRMGDRDKALAYYNESLKYRKNNAMVLSNMGTIYFERQQFNEAINLFQRAIKTNPRHTDALSNLASSYGSIGMFNEAVTYFLEALKYDPNNKNNMRMLGMTYQSLGKNEEARYWLQQAQN